MSFVSILFNFSLLPVFFLYSFFEYFYSPCPVGFSLRDGICLKNCPSYALELESKCILYSNFDFDWKTAEAFCNDLDGELLFERSENNLVEAMKKLNEMLLENYPKISELRKQDLFIAGVSGWKIKDELRRKREIVINEEIKPPHTKDDICPSVRFNHKSNTWQFVMTSCILKQSKGKKRKVAQNAFICQFPLASFQESINEQECGLPQLDPVGEPSHLWPIHIDTQTKKCDKILNMWTLDRMRQKRVVHGHPSNFSYWPWYGSLKGCGSTLVHSNFVITAAHCRNVPNIHFGVDKQHPDWRENKFTLIPDQIKVPNTRNILSGCKTDLQVVKLNQSVILEVGIAQPICLPNYGAVFSDQTHFCFMAGYGLTKNTAMDGTSRHLQQIQLHPVATKGPMQHFHPANETLKNLPQRGGGALGDSGGPVICRPRDSLKWELVGPFCGGRGSDGYAAHLAHWKPWLDKVMYDMTITTQD